MSSLRYIPTSLSEIIEESNLIVEVQCLDQYSEEVSVKNRDLAISIQPFIKKGLVFKIKSIFKNTTGIKIPEIIQVPEEDWRRKMRKYNEKHGNATSRAFKVKKYDATVPPFKKSTFLFLYHFQDMFELTAANSFESEEAREKIEMLVK